MIDAIASNNISMLQNNKQNISENSNEEVNKNVNFESFLKDSLDKVNDTQIEADTSVQKLMTGETKDLHSVMLASEEAKITLELAIQIRNKLVDAYQEINRIQI